MAWRLPVSPRWILKAAFAFSSCCSDGCELAMKALRAGGQIRTSVVPVEHDLSRHAVSAAVGDMLLWTPRPSPRTSTLYAVITVNSVELKTEPSNWRSRCRKTRPARPSVERGYWRSGIRQSQLRQEQPLLFRWHHFASNSGKLSGSFNHHGLFPGSWRAGGLQVSVSG